MRVTVLPVIIGALGTILKSLVRRLEELEIGGRAGTIQIFLRSARILRRVLETLGDLLSLELFVEDYQLILMGKARKA